MEFKSAMIAYNPFWRMHHRSYRRPKVISIKIEDVEKPASLTHGQLAQVMSDTGPLSQEETQYLDRLYANTQFIIWAEDTGLFRVRRDSPKMFQKIIATLVSASHITPAVGSSSLVRNKLLSMSNKKRPGMVAIFDDWEHPLEIIEREGIDTPFKSKLVLQNQVPKNVFTFSSDVTIGDRASP